MTFHIYNAPIIVDKIVFGLQKIKSKYRDEELSKDIDEFKDELITSMIEQSRNIEIRGVLKQRINTFRAEQLECTDVRRWWSEAEYLNIARQIPAIEEFLKEVYGRNYQAFVNKMITYKSILNDIKYRKDIEINNKYTVTNPDQRKFIHETEQKISKLSLTNEEAKRVGMLLDTFTSMGDMTVPSTTLQQARAKYRKIEYEQTDKRETAREFMMDGRGE